MALRYFTPVIQKIHSIKEENGFSYWDTETDRGACRFTVRMAAGASMPSGRTGISSPIWTAIALKSRSSAGCPPGN